jgi:hypothetical protein
MSAMYLFVLLIAESKEQRGESTEQRRESEEETAESRQQTPQRNICMYLYRTMALRLQ